MSLKGKYAVFIILQKQDAIGRLLIRVSSHLFSVFSYFSSSEMETLTLEIVPL